MVSDTAYADLGLLGAAGRILTDEGSSGLLGGVPATCIKQLPYTATKQVRPNPNPNRNPNPNPDPDPK